MEKNFYHIVNSLKRYLLVFAVGIVVLLTSCVVKSSIRSWAGVPTQSEQGLPKGSRNANLTSVEICSQTDVSEGLIQGKGQLEANNLLPFLFLSAIWLGLFGISYLYKENTHPLYTDSAKIRSELPLFLEYRRLILPFKS